MTCTDLCRISRTLLPYVFGHDLRRLFSSALPLWNGKTAALLHFVRPCFLSRRYEPPTFIVFAVLRQPSSNKSTKKGVFHIIDIIPFNFPLFWQLIRGVRPSNSFAKAGHVCSNRTYLGKNFFTMTSRKRSLSNKKDAF